MKDFECDFMPFPFREAPPRDAEFEISRGRTKGRQRESVGSISKSDYIKWVQRSLNRRYGAKLPIDGRISRTYREAVRAFNIEHLFRDDEIVDTQTQDELIYENEANARYVRWVIRSLNQIGLGPLPDSDTFSTAVVAAIQKFQQRPELRIKADGYIGAKTELALMRASDTQPPGRAKPESPKADPVKRLKALAGRLLRVAGIIDASDSDVIRKKRVLCIIRKITSAIVDGAKLDDSFLVFNPPLGATSFRLGLTQQLLERYSEADDAALIRGINTLYKKMLEPMLALNMDFQLLLLELTSDPLRGISKREILRGTEECKRAAFFIARAKDPRSIYSCLAAWILTTFKDCEASR